MREVVIKETLMAGRAKLITVITATVGLVVPEPKAGSARPTAAS
jgi:hypothetical protein